MTTRKNFNPAIKAYLLDIISFEDGMENVTDAEKVQYVRNRFMSEYGHEIKRKGQQSALVEWLRGIPLATEYTYFDIEQLLLKWGILTGKETEAATDKALDQYWVRLASNLIQMFRKYA